MYNAGMAEATDIDQMVSNVTAVENSPQLNAENHRIELQPPEVPAGLVCRQQAERLLKRLKPLLLK